MDMRETVCPLLCRGVCACGCVRGHDPSVGLDSPVGFDGDGHSPDLHDSERAAEGGGGEGGSVQTDV